MDPRLERIAKNQAVFRAVNAEIEQAERRAGVGTDERIEVLCECGRDSCDGVVGLTLGEYDRVHSQEDRFVVLPGHRNPEIERVVEEREGYVVVDKFGQAEEIAEGDPG